MFYVYITLFSVIVVVAIFNKKKWAHTVLAFNTGIGFILYGLFGEIFEFHETVHWLHIIWGVINILIGLACLGISFRSMMRLNQKLVKYNSTSGNNKNSSATP